jgi:aryl-alcohol dehydrogenase-like predicted oxidoreductase
MDYTYLGRTGLSVSRLVLGTMNFGNQTDESTSRRIMDAALEAGVNFFDTANRYGGTFGAGVTETVIGDWFAQGGQRREKVVLGTKVYGSMMDWPNHDRLSALNIRRALDASLTRLRTDYIDLYQFHHVDRTTPWDEIWQAIETAIAQGKILYAGSSNFAGWHIATAQATARERGLMGLVSEQSIYNLINRSVEVEVLPAAEANGMGLIAWSPLNGGLLAGAMADKGSGVRRFEGRAAEDLEKHQDALRDFEALAGELGISPATLALAWVLHRPGVTGPIVGPRTPEQLASALGSIGVALSAETIARLDVTFPGHLTAPEEYAW